MSKSIAVFGAGPALGRAVAHRYAHEGYAVALVARRREPLDQLAQDLISAGATAHAITADLSKTDAVASLAGQIRERVGELDTLYYGPSTGGSVRATELTPQHLQAFMPFALYTFVALVHQFLPHMLDQRNGAILTAQGASAVQGMPNFAGAGPALAAERNYLQSLHAEVADRGVYVGGLYIGATIENSAYHAKLSADRAAGRPTPNHPTVDPDHLADLLWTMQSTRARQELVYPEDIFDRRGTSS